MNNNDRQSQLPEWAVRWAYPELAQEVRQFEPGQLREYRWGGVSIPLSGEFIYHLEEVNVLFRCLNLQEALFGCIVPNGTLSDRFRGEHLCLWRSTCVDTNGHWFMPWIQNLSGQVPVIRWWWTRYQLYPNHLTMIL